MSTLSTWLTPIWFLSIGVAIAAAVLLSAWGVCWLINRSAARSVFYAIKEGILLPISYLVIAMTLFAVLASTSMDVSIGRTLASLRRLPSVRPISITVVAPPGATHVVELETPFRADELQSYTINSEQDVVVNVDENAGYIDPLIQVLGGEQFQWSPGSPLPRQFEGDVERLYIVNESDLPSEVSMTFETDVELVQVRQLPIVATAVIGLYAVYLLLFFLAPRTSVIAVATAKETMSQPLYVLLTAIGAVAMIVYVYTPYNTLGEDIKMLETSGMTTIKILAIVVALWSASVSVADEIEGRTALTVLSKPLSRRQFILGKFLGIVWPLVLMFIVLGFVFLMTVSYKVVYDAREAAKTTPGWEECYGEVVRIIPGMVLAFFEAVILAAISVAASTRLSMLPNLVICGSIYVLGHLAALIVRSSVGEENVFVQFIGKLLSVVLPVLDHFEVEGYVAAATADPFPLAYLSWALLYTLIYCAIAMLLALIFFEDRDLA